MTDRVLLEVEGHVARVVLNRPDKRNALDDAMFQGILDAARQIAATASIRVVVLSGAGGCFCSGLDFSSFGAMASGELDAESESVQAAARDLSQAGANRAQQIGWCWQELAVPVIAAIEGAAYGGGLHIALGADIRYVAPDARLAFVETSWGLVPDLSGTQALRRLVPLDVAKQLIFSGEEVSGTRAVELGLATELAERPVEAALDLAERLTQRSPDALRAAKALLNRSALVSVAEGLGDEFATSARLMGTPNQPRS